MPVQAVAAVFKMFETFKQKPGNESLRLRATATEVDKVVVYKDPSSWFGPTLNEFLKYERQLAGPFPFAVTRSLRACLGRKMLGYFPDDPTHKRSVTLALPNEKRATEVYCHKDYPPNIPESAIRFWGWLNSNQALLPQPTLLSPPDANLAKVVGNAAIIDTAITEDGYHEIEMIPLVFPEEEFRELIAPFNDRWQSLVDADKNLKGEKAAPLRMQGETSDDPRLRIQWARNNYALVHPLDAFVRKNRDVQEAFIANAFDIRKLVDANNLPPGTSGRCIPGTITTCCAVVMDGLKGDDKSGKRYLLLSHRAPRVRGGFDNDTWSVSFEEQFSPVQWTEERAQAGQVASVRVHPKDDSPFETAVRGFKEEFVGKNYAYDVPIAFYATCVELTNYYIDLVGVIRLTGRTFQDIFEPWYNREADDATEHDHLAALRLDEEILTRALRGPGPAGFLTHFPKAAPCSEEVEKHPWHPTSAVRLACCLWLLKQNLL